jgi:hypothetical protein
MLSGVKRVMMFPPDQTPFLYRVGAVGKCKHATPQLPGGRLRPRPRPRMSAATWDLAGDVLRSSTRPTLNPLLLLRASV